MAAVNHQISHNYRVDWVPAFAGMTVRWRKVF